MVTEYGITRASDVHGCVCAASAQPPQRSTSHPAVAPDREGRARTRLLVEHVREDVLTREQGGATVPVTSMAHDPGTITATCGSARDNGPLQLRGPVVDAIRFQLLGPMVLVDGVPAKLPGVAERALLVQLLLTPGRTIPATFLVDRLWSETSLLVDPMNALQIRVPVAAGARRHRRRRAGHP